MSTATFEQRRSQIEAYFDRTASAAWARLTSDQKLGRIRATVRAGRDQMRTTLLDCLDADLAGRRVLDAGSGTGAAAVALAARGAQVTAIDLSVTLINLARDRAGVPARGSLTFLVGDMTNPALGRFDHVVAMDSLIHYGCPDMVRILAGYAARTERSIVFTFAPRTRLLAVMHAIGRLFPRGERSPALEPVAERRLRDALAAEPAMNGWRIARSSRVDSGFYISQAMELVRL
jgi:magnesium-protoporphyrin O-methyltransferase